MKQLGSVGPGSPVLKCGACDTVFIAEWSGVACPICAHRFPGASAETLRGMGIYVGDSRQAHQKPDEQAWETFRSSGLLWFINTILHVFGWAIIVEVSEAGDITGAFPARVRFRGFSESDATAGYRAVSAYMRDLAVQLDLEANS